MTPEGVSHVRTAELWVRELALKDVGGWGAEMLAGVVMAALTTAEVAVFVPSAETA
jgi:hypothetical protein